MVYPQILISQTQAFEYNSVVALNSTATQDSVGSTQGINPPRNKGTAFSEAVLCSCVKGVREFIPNMPYGDANNIFANTEAFEGAVAIFWFPPSDMYPEGTKHVAYVAKIEGDRFYIKQTNKETCKYTEEWVSFSSANLLGFYTPDIDK